MIRPEYLNRLANTAHADLYLSGVDGARIWWPWRMQPVHEADQRHRNACEQFIVDSSFADQSITNQDVLDMAHTLDAEIAVLADVYQDCDATVDALVAGLDCYADHAFDGQVMLPLQPPHAGCYQRLQNRGVGDEHLFAIGGVKDRPDAEKLRAARDVRDLLGSDGQLHGLGFGVTEQVAAAIRAEPGLLDSIDYSSPIQSVLDSSVLPGPERMSVVAARAGAELVEDLRAITPHVRTDDQQQTLATVSDGAMQ